MNGIAEKIKKARQMKGYTLKEMNARTGLSVSFLSQVENGSSSLAITSLKKIADALEVPIKAFFDDYEEHSYVTKSEEQHPFKLEKANIEYRRLSGDFPDRKIETILVKMGSNEKHREIFTHPGEELVYILEGVLIVNLDGKEYLLKKGDTMHYPSNIPHFWINPIDRENKFLSTTTQVFF
ncbi:MAG: XRE family transcriptional regulator [Tissierellales bacterium]|jgi:transcriptional regulator with XRE-family HTH domain|nr:XRE family transcriptional regulator [Tissierellales bacterium]